ncbi:unnamed protein product, partial [Polarella glacialis]
GEMDAHLSTLLRDLPTLQDFQALRGDLEVKTASQQAGLSSIQAQSEQTRLQVSEMRSDLAALRERQEIQVSSLQSDLRRELDALHLSQAQQVRELRLEHSQAAERHSEVGRRGLAGAHE